MYKIIVMDNFIDALEELPKKDLDKLKESFLSVSKLDWNEISSCVNKNNILNEIIKI